jgi:hypothetical protein
LSYQGRPKIEVFEFRLGKAATARPAIFLIIDPAGFQLVKKMDLISATSKISGHQQQGGPGPFQGPSSYPQLCWWSLI